ncbi:MAG: helix-turn-helix domain containing protein [Candidatus Fibromonas sp.]|nr:helix-turn-helix domain containing protein [Candidatus Fibromonas sp.]
MKKIITIILALIALCLGFYALVHFAGLNPDEFFQKSSGKAEFQGTVNPEKMQQLRDSLDNIYIAIHYETDERLLKNLKETQKNLWERIASARNAIDKADAPKSIKEEESDLVDALIKGISVTAAILLAIIILLIIKITRRSKEVEKVTERLKNLQTEPMPPPPLEGLDPTVFSTRFPRPPLPQVKPIEQSETPLPPAPEPPKMRKTTKQRVTEAVQKMVAALDSLRKYGNTVKTTAADGSIAGERLTKTNIRVPSPNSTRISPPVDETTYDRRAREKKQILDYAKQGRTPSEIAKWLNLPRDQVETVIRLARERGE